MISLTPEIRERLLHALDDGHPVIVACVDAEGAPRVSFRGSVHAFSGDQLAMWARNAEGGLVRAIASNPRVAFVYYDMRDRPRRVFLRMSGRARRTDDPAERDRIFEGMNPTEQKADPERNGVAIIVDLDEVAGRSSEGEIIRMTRDDG